jgi:putative solute:sodium symporter small subunit
LPHNACQKGVIFNHGTLVDIVSRQQEDNMEKSMRLYWKSNLRYMVILLTIWALVSYVFGILLVNELNAFHLGGFPLGFWFAQQGSIYVFVILILAYFLLMDRLDKKFDVHE